MSTVLGIDLGTQHLKVLAYDSEQAQTIAVESESLTLDRDQNGKAEQQADSWLDALRACVSRLEPHVRRSVRAIGVSGQQHGLVAMQGDNVLHPVKLWCDTSSEAECTEITNAFGGVGACIQEVGNPILAGYTASKIRWLRNHKADVYAHMDSILLPHDYLNFFLTGERCMEAGDASGTGFLNIRKREWSQEMLLAIDSDRDLSACLPRLRIENEAIGRVSSRIAESLDLPGTALVSIGGGDNMMSAIGTRNVREGNVTISLGTSGTVIAYSDTPVIDPDGQIAAFCSSTGGYLPLLCTMNCTASSELMRKLLKSSLSDLESQLTRSQPGAQGVLLVTFFGGERTPNLPKAKACLFGMDGSNTTRANVMRATIEGVTYSLRFGLERLADLGVNASLITLTGGGSNSHAWRQIVADVMGLPVSVADQSETAAFGAALQALHLVDDSQGRSIDDVTSRHVSIDPSQSCEPDPIASEFYAENYERYLGTVEVVTDVYH